MQIFGVPAGRKESTNMPVENVINDVTDSEEGRGIFRFILDLIRSVVTAVVDMGKNLVSSLIEWVIGTISALVQRVITRIATEV